MNWLRLHHEARTDKKLAALSDAQFRVWFNLLCFSGEQPIRGEIQFDDLDLLAIEVAGGDTTLLGETIERLSKMKIVKDGDSIAFINFQKRQYDKPSDAPERVSERVKKHRERHGNATTEPCNADVTRGNALYTETETETKTENEGLPTGDAPQAATKPEPTIPVKPVDAPKPVKPRTAAQLASDALFNRRTQVIHAYFRGLEIDIDGVAARQRATPSFTTLKGLGADVLDSADMQPDVIETLTRYVMAARAWRDGDRTPSFADVLKALPEWDQAGRPDKPPPRSLRTIAGGKPRYDASGQRLLTSADLRRMSNGESLDEPDRNASPFVDPAFRVAESARH